ncbi:MAG TPA: hypothetical protein VIY51_03480 [Xanthobacteraceae bacterium]
MIRRYRKRYECLIGLQKTDRGTIRLPPKYPRHCGSQVSAHAQIFFVPHCSGVVLGPDIRLVARKIDVKEVQHGG